MVLAVALFSAVAVEIFAAFFLSIKSGGRCRRDRLVDNNNNNNKFTIRRSQMIFRAVLSGSVLSAAILSGAVLSISVICGGGGRFRRNFFVDNINNKR